jgi:hypothetical protein
MPDPKITAVTQKIAELLTEADLAGVAFVASPSHTHYLHHIEASWTACRMESPTAMRFRCRRADYPTEAEWKETMRLSTGLLCGLHSALEHTAEALEVMLRQIGKRVEIEHMDKDEGAVPLQVEALRGPGLKPPAALKPDAEVFSQALTLESKAHPLPTVRIDMDEPTLTAVVGALQLALRHPAFKSGAGPTYQTVRNFVDVIIERLPAERPLLKQLMQMGDKPERDR